MPLNYSSLEQVSGWRFLRHRLSVAIARHSARLVHDPSRNASASLLVGVVASVLIVGICFVIAFFKPTGMVGDSPIVADRASGAIYVEVGQVMHPALNLASARLIAGRADNPKMVPIAEIRKHPIGPLVGIVGAPDDLAVQTPVRAGWGLCDRLGSMGTKVAPRVTVLSGLPELGDWSREVTAPDAVLMSYGSDTFLVTDGRRSKLDLADKPVTLALGIQAGAVTAAPMSRALYEALIPTAPLRVPDVAGPGLPVGYATAALPLVAGSVLKASDATGAHSFFVALAAGVQMVPETVAVMLTNANTSGQSKVWQTESSVIASLPQAVGFEVGMYPPGQVRLRSKEQEPVTCVMWRKGAGEPQATISTVSGRRLPVSLENEARVTDLVAGPQQGAASSVYVGRDAANFVQVTGVEPDSIRSESLWWISDSGVRFGVETQSGDRDGNRKALGLMASPTPAPWAVIRWLPAGAVLSKEAAMTQHDTLLSEGPTAPLVDGKGQR